MQELQNFTNKESSDLHKITQTCTTAQENTSRLVQDVISQALSSPQDRTTQELTLPENPETLT